MLHFDLDAREIALVTAELGLTEKQAKFALSRALRRTAATLRQRAERGLKSELDLKKVAYMRRRLKAIKFSKAGFDGAKLWFGANDMPVSALRGSISEGGGGASFAGKAGKASFPGGFFVKGRFGRTIMKRKGTARLPIEEARVPVKDRIDVFVEDQVFDQVPEIFWKHFLQDMRARAAGFGNKFDRFS